jgi:hypothetical protein
MMIRTIVTPERDRILLPIPKDYIGVELEVIAFTKPQKTDLKKGHAIDIQTRLLLEKVLRKESKAVHVSSVEVLKEFENND